MKLHVLPGDSLAEEFRKTELKGDVVICRECLISGDVNAESLPEFWEQRSRFILSAFGEDEIEYHEKVADELVKLIDLPEGTEVNLWFEYELFCSVNLWFCIYLLQDTEAEIYRIEPLILPVEERWKGFGGLDASELKKCFEGRTKLSGDDIRLGVSLWRAYSRNDHLRLNKLSKANAENFPYLEEACESAINKETRPLEILSDIRADGFETLPEIFPEFVNRAGEYGFGDGQIKYLLERIT